MKIKSAFQLSLIALFVLAIACKKENDIRDGKIRDKSTAKSNEVKVEPPKKPVLAFDALVDSGAKIYSDSLHESLLETANSDIPVKILVQSKNRDDSISDCQQYYWYKIKTTGNSTGWVSGRYLFKNPKSNYEEPNSFRIDGENYTIGHLYEVGIPIGDEEGITGCWTFVIPYVYSKEYIHFFSLDSSKIRSYDVYEVRKGKLGFIIDEVDFTELDSLSRTENGKFRAKINLSRSDAFDKVEVEMTFENQKFVIDTIIGIPVNRIEYLKRSGYPI